MTDQPSDLAAVMGRLERLERQNRWMKRAGAVVLVLAGVAVLMGGQGQPGKTGEPEKLVLRDDKGNERAWLGMARDGPVLRFRDEGGKERLWLGLVKDTPGLAFYDDQGKRRAALSTGRDMVSLLLYDRQEKQRAWLVLSDRAAALHLLGRGGERHAGLSVEADGVAVWHHDEAGRVQAGANAAIKNGPGLSPHGELVDPLFSRPE
jgi:hypothetical protein